MDHEMRNDLLENGNANSPTPNPSESIVPPMTPPPTPQEYPSYPMDETSAKPAPRPRTQSGATKSKSGTSAKKDIKTTRSHSNKEKSSQSASMTTASSNSTASRQKKQPVNTAIPRSARPAHRVIPYLWLVLAAFVAVCLISNLFCNMGNKLASNPSAHWIGTVGYFICYWLFGLFGPAVFVLPVLLAALGIYWRRYIDNHLATFKIITSLIFMILLGAVIHVSCLSIWDPQSRMLTADQLIIIGSQMTMGGLLGGGFGYFLTTYLNIVGSLIIGICLLLIALFCILGMTPHHLWEQIRTRRQTKQAGRGTVSEADAQAASLEAKMQEKMRRTASKREADIFDQPDETVVETLRRIRGRVKNDIGGEILIHDRFFAAAVGNKSAAEKNGVR